MKKIFLFLVIFALSFGAKAQTWTPIFGKQRFASGLGIPVKDSTYFAGTADSALVYINPKDAGFYYKYKGYHKKLGTGTISSISLIMPSAFSVSGSPLTSNGSFIVTGAGSITQYIRGDGSLATLNTAVVPESGNLYYTDARARAAISGTSPISVTSGVVSISQASGSTNGYLSSTDWTTFNSKQTALNGTGFVKQSGTTTTYDNTAYYPASNPNGYTSNTGTVTSVALTAPSAFTVTGSPVTTSGTLALGAAGNSTQYIDGSGSLQTFPTMLSSDNLIKLVRNQSGATMTAGTIVYIDGATGNKPTIAKALATSDATSAQTYGAVQADIANNADGYIVVIGNINNLNTSGLTEGSQLYLSSTTAGAYTTTKQYAPAHLVYVGIVLRAHPTQGVIGVKIQNGYELDELHNVAAQTPSNNDGLFYESSTSLWKNKSIATVLGYTPEQPLTFSAPLSRSTNTVSIPAATGSANGYLSSTDWTTFNGKQNAITLTTTGSSGSATFVSNTLNVPTYTLAGLGGQPQLNGTGFVKASGTTISYDNSTYALDADVVKLAGSQTITGVKTFSGAGNTFTQNTNFQDRIYLKWPSTSTYTSVGGDVDKLLIGVVGATHSFSFSENVNYTYTFPAASGTVALTSGLTGFVSGSGTSGQVPLFNGTQSVTNSQIYDNGNTVSIGNSVTSPNKLVSFSTNASGFAILGSGSGGAGGIISAVTSGSGDMYRGSTSNGGYFISDNAGNTYISGKMGIGTYGSSSYNLNVVGTGYFSGALDANIISANSVGSTQIFLKSSGAGANRQWQIQSNETAAGDLSFMQSTAAGGSTYVTKFNLSPTGAATFSSSIQAGGRIKQNVVGNGAQNTYDITSTNSTGTSNNWSIGSNQTVDNAFQISGNGNQIIAITQGGKVGIGNLDAYNTLDVKSTGNGSSQIFSASFRDNSSYGNGLGIANLNNESRIYSTYFTGSSDQDLSFWTTIAGGNQYDRIHIKANGNIGINTTIDAGYKLDISGSLRVNTAGTSLFTASSQTLSGDILVVKGGGSGGAYGFSVQANNGDKILWTDNLAYNVIIGGTGSGGAGALTIRRDAGIPASIANESASGTLIRFAGNGSGVLGSITHNGATTSYNITSDYRLKEDLKPIKGLEIVNKINVYDYKWKANNSRMDGVLAHELQEILPYAVQGVKDGEQMQSVDYSKIVPVMIQAIKELNQKITNLEAQIKQ